MTDSVLELSAVSKDYRGLRPLRIDRFTLHAGEQVAILGVDQPSAEAFIHLVTGTILPDTGEVRVGGRSTAAIADSTEWLALADTFGLLSERAVLLDAFTALQNLAIPFSLDVDPLPPASRDAARLLAHEVGLPEEEWECSLSTLSASSRLRVRLGRAIALQPRIVLGEHPSAGLARPDVSAVGREIRRVCEARAVACLTLTADPELATAVAHRVLTLEPASGQLKDAKRSWFGRRRG